MPSMPSPPPSAQLTSPSDFPSRTSTRLVVSVPCQSAVSRPVSSRPVWSSPSAQSAPPPRSSPSRCITRRLTKPPQVTTLVSTSRTCPSRISREATSALTPRTTQPRIPRCSSLRLSFLTTQVRSKTDTPQSSTATLLTLPASSPRSALRSTSVPVSPLRTSHPPSRLVTPLWLSSSHKSPWSLRSSPPTHHSAASPSV